jgi:hypothetical protein
VTSSPAPLPSTCTFSWVEPPPSTRNQERGALSIPLPPGLAFDPPQKQGSAIDAQPIGEDNLHRLPFGDLSGDAKRKQLRAPARSGVS